MRLKRSSSFLNGVGRRAAGTKRAGPITKVAKNGKPKFTQSVRPCALDAPEANHIRERKKMSCYLSPAGDSNVIASSNRLCANYVSDASVRSTNFCTAGCSFAGRSSAGPSSAKRPATESVGKCSCYASAGNQAAAGAFTAIAGQAGTRRLSADYISGNRREPDGDPSGRLPSGCG